MNAMNSTSAAGLRLNWLGVPSIEYEGRPIHLEMRKTLAILAYLSLEAHSSIRESVAAMFWPDHDQQHALANLRRNLSSLTASLPEEMIEADREKIGLRGGDGLWVDVQAFRVLHSRVKEHAHAAGPTCSDCQSWLEQAAKLYRGDFLAGFTLRDCPEFDEWQLYQRESLRSDHDELLRRLAAHWQAQGEWEKAIDYSRQRVAGNPLNEAAQRQLISLYQSSGQRGLALQQYETLKDALQSELGLSPEAESASLYQSLLIHVGASRDQDGQILPAATDRDSEPLLKTKLYFPPARADQVARPRLLELLNAGTQRSLTLISAPAGFGKTTLLTSWAMYSELPIAWYAIDEGDNDPARFIAYLVAALDSLLSPGLGTKLRAYPQALQPSLQPMLVLLINTLVSLQEPLVLILDDYQNIHSMEIHQALGFLIERIPACLHLVIATRTDPPLPLARLRARDQLAEIRMPALQFSLAETADFFTRSMKLNISPEDVSALENRTEGWIAGLQMAALAIRSLNSEGLARGDNTGQGEAVSDYIQSFSASNRFVMDYLSEEVLSHCPEQMCQFLLQTSILERFSAPLCEAVTACDGSRAILDQLERENVFLVALDNERDWYRYHPIFAELLRIKLAEMLSGGSAADRMGIASVEELHRRAATWMEGNGYPDEAIQHYMAAKDYPQAADLIESQTQRIFFILGQSYTVLQWCAQLPPATMQSRPRLNIARAWALIGQSRFSEAAQALKNAQEAMSAWPAAQQDSLLGEIALIQGALAELSSRDVEVMHLKGQYAWERLPEEQAMLRGLAAWLLGAAYFYEGDTLNAETYFVHAIQLCRQSGNIFFTVISIVDLGNILKEQGRFGEAYRLLSQAEKEMSAGDFPAHPGLVYLYNGLGQILYARNELLEAELMLQRGIEMGGQGVPGEIPIFSLSSMAYIKLALGKLDEARRLGEECLVRAEAYPLPYVPATVRASLIRLWMTLGEQVQIEAWPAGDQLKVEDTIHFTHEAEYIALARLRLWQGDTQQALKILNQLAYSAKDQGREGKLITILALQALALNQAGESDQAMTALETSLVIAQREGIIRPFLDEGKSLEALIKMGEARGAWEAEISGEFISRLLNAMQQGQGWAGKKD
jgi:LuxR family maltose regulon positive regulatory protein